MTPTMALASLLSPWGLFQLAAVLLGAVLWAWRGRGGGIVFAAGVLGAAVGAVALGVVLRAPAMLLTGAWGGLEITSFGALAGLATGVALAAHRVGGGVPRALDRLAMPMGGMVAVARLGCFQAGCDFGQVSTLPWAVRYGIGTPAWFHHRHLGVVSDRATTSAAVHPTQLYEVAVGIAMLALAWHLGRDPKRNPGASFALTASTYAAGRFLIELLRADHAHSGWGALSMPQWLALAVFASAAAWWARDSADAPSVNDVSRSEYERPHLPRAR